MHSDNVTISTFQLFQLFPDQEAARDYLEARLWPAEPRCPVCQSTENATTRKRGESSVMRGEGTQVCNSYIKRG